MAVGVAGALLVLQDVTHDPAVDKGHEVVTLGGGNELAGICKGAVVLMQPDQDLCFLFELPAYGRDGLGVEDEAVILEGLGKPRYPPHLTATAQELVVGGFVGANHVAALFFGQPAGVVGRGKHVVDVGVSLFEGNDGKTGGDIEGILLPDEAALHGFVHVTSDLRRAAHVRVE